MIDNTVQTFIQNSEDESPIQLSDIWGMIWGHKWWYVACTFICLFVAAFYIYRTPDTYVRTAKVMIDESDQDAAMRNLGVISNLERPKHL